VTWSDGTSALLGHGDGGSQPPYVRDGCVRFVALGDSFAEGVGDEHPLGRPIGWADRVAYGLGAAHDDSEVRYANLAIRGRLLASIAGPQLRAALTLDPGPTLVAFSGGGNDIIRPRSSLSLLVDMTARAVDACLATGAHVVLIASADPSDRMPFGPVVRSRGLALTEQLGMLAAGRGLTFVDLFTDPEIRRAHYWAPDRIHLNALGHERAARLVLAELGVPAGSLAAIPPPPRVRMTAAMQLDYFREYVAPWMLRRMRGRSSGDGLLPKYGTWTAPTDRWTAPAP
jgi:lysophospholipase L1-like esterase